MSTATVATQSDLTLGKLQSIVQQQEGIFGPLTQIRIEDRKNVLEFAVRARPGNRAILKQVAKGGPKPKKGLVLVCEGACYLSGRKTRVAAFRAGEK